MPFSPSVAKVITKDLFKLKMCSIKSLLLVLHPFCQAYAVLSHFYVYVIFYKVLYLFLQVPEPS